MYDELFAIIPPDDRHGIILDIPFAVACQMGNFDVAQTLLNAGDPHKDRALVLVCKEGNLDAVQWLVDRGANVQFNYSRPLQAAVQSRPASRRVLSASTWREPQSRVVRGGEAFQS